MDIVESIKNGDHRAFATLVNQYHRSIYFQTLKIVRSPSDAEDLTMEVFSKVFMKIDKYSPEFAFSTWLHRIARNHSIDFIRKKRLGVISIDNEDSVSVTSKLENPSPNPEDSIIISQRNSILRDIVKSMPIKDSRLIEMRYFEEMSYEEISAETDIPYGTIKVQLFRARNKLMKLITDVNLQR